VFKIDAVIQFDFLCTCYNIVLSLYPCILSLLCYIVAYRVEDEKMGICLFWQHAIAI